MSRSLHEIVLHEETLVRLLQLVCDHLWPNKHIPMLDNTHMAVLIEAFKSFGCQLEGLECPFLVKHPELDSEAHMKIYTIKLGSGAIFSIQLRESVDHTIDHYLASIYRGLTDCYKVPSWRYDIEDPVKSVLHPLLEVMFAPAQKNEFEVLLPKAISVIEAEILSHQTEKVMLHPVDRRL